MLNLGFHAEVKVINWFISTVSRLCSNQVKKHTGLCVLSQTSFKVSLPMNCKEGDKVVCFNVAQDPT